MRELTGLDLESSEVSRPGGYVTSLIGHLPQPGESVRIEDYLVTVLSTDGGRVRQLRFREGIADSQDAQTACDAPFGFDAESRRRFRFSARPCAFRTPYTYTASEQIREGWLYMKTSTPA